MLSTKSSPKIKQTFAECLDGSVNNRYLASSFLVSTNRTWEIMAQAQGQWASGFRISKHVKGRMKSLRHLFLSIDPLPGHNDSFAEQKAPARSPFPSAFDAVSRSGVVCLDHLRRYFYRACANRRNLGQNTERPYKSIRISKPKSSTHHWSFSFFNCSASLFLSQQKQNGIETNCLAHCRSVRAPVHGGISSRTPPFCRNLEHTTFA